MSFTGKKHTLESRQKMSESHQGRKVSLETRRKLRKANRGENNPMWGRKHSLETRRKMSGRKGKNAYAWKGGKIYTDEGYIYVYQPDHPNAIKKGYVLEHRLVMEKHLGRFLESYEIVHHINGVRDDNQVENLELFPKSGKHHALTLATNAQIMALKADMERWRNAYFHLLMVAMVKTNWGKEHA